MPYYPLPDSEGHKYTTTTYWERLVSEYTGLPLPAVYDLNLIEFLTYRRDAFIWKMSRTEKGTEYLDNAWRCEQTEPDREALRKFKRKEGVQNVE
ncbi:MAG: hypothetical protein IJL32_05485 [Oscillospiraceae bacterium]|nr:hypothetical protein [Oscillospiraceae bacterium]